eukprot:3163680-Prymnesium_polylepis.1
MAFPLGPVANGLAAAAALAAANIASIAAIGLAQNARIQVQVSEPGEPELWWPAGVGGPATGAGGHGVVIVYDAWPQQGHTDVTTSRACLMSNGQTLLDVDEMATWRWRHAMPPLPTAPLPAAPLPA